MPLYERLRPILRLWYARELAFGALTAKPTDAPSIRSGRPDALRVLLLGNGPACGWGTLTHQLAIPGQLARALGRRTAMGWDIDYVGDEPMSMATALPWLGTTELRGYDAVVIMVGMNDAVRLTSVREWEAHLRPLLDHVTAGVEDGTPVLVTNIPRPSLSSRFAKLFPRVVDRHAKVLDGTTERMVSALLGAEYVDLAPSPDEELECSAAYHVLAAQIDGHVRVEIDGVRQPVPRAAATGWDTALTAGILERLRSGAEPELQRIADEAKRLMKAHEATISLLDGDRLHYALNNQRLPQSIPLGLSYCRVVVDGDAPLLVPNHIRDERFRDNPLLRLAHIPFYAGVPLHARDGHPVGSLCVLNGHRKRARAVPTETLARLGRAAQTELLRIEAEVRREQSAGDVQRPAAAEYELTS